MPNLPITHTALASDATAPGTVARLNLEEGFGYVCDDGGRGTYIFLAEVVSNRVFGVLRVGQAVRFELDVQGRVVRLVPAQGPT